MSVIFLLLTLWRHGLGLAFFGFKFVKFLELPNNLSFSMICLMFILDPNFFEVNLK